MPNPKPKPSRKPRALSLSLTLGLTLSLALTQAAFSLLDQPGTDANCRDAGGRSVLMIAACAGHGDLVRLLLQVLRARALVLVSSRRGEAGGGSNFSLLTARYSLLATHDSRLTTHDVPYYSQHGADTDAKDFASGHTALQMAKQRGQQDVVEALDPAAAAAAEAVRRARGSSYGPPSDDEEASEP